MSNSSERICPTHEFVEFVGEGSKGWCKTCWHGGKMMIGRDADVHRAEAEAQSIAESGTMACPICGVGEPHTHSEREIKRYRWRQGIRLEGECGCCPGTQEDPASDCKCACHDVRKTWKDGY